MTQVYFVRHAEPNYMNHDDATRELTPAGRESTKRVTAFLLDKGITAVMSSPYRRAVETMRDFADTARLPIIHVPDFRERQVDAVWIDDFNSFCRRQWADFDYRLRQGESLREVQNRNVAALEQILRTYAGQRVAIGGHGTAICTVLNHYDKSFGFEGFQAMRRLMPWIVRLDFDGQRYLGRTAFDIRA